MNEQDIFECRYLTLRWCEQQELERRWKERVLFLTEGLLAASAFVMIFFH